MHAYIRFRERPEAPARRASSPGSSRATTCCRRWPSISGNRMGGVTWMIGTPEASVMWDGATLHHTGPLMSSAADLDRCRRSALADLLPQHLQPGARECPADAKPYPVALLEEPAGRRDRPGHGQQRRARRAQHRPGAGGGPEERLHDPDRPGRRPARAPAAARNSTNAGAASCGSMRPRPWPAKGRRQAQIMLVGEQPGDQEDLAGKAVRRPGRQAAGPGVRGRPASNARAIYLTNAVKHFKWEPRGKRRLHKTPAQREVEACSYWLEKELAAVKPTGHRGAGRDGAESRARQWQREAGGVDRQGDPARRALGRHRLPPVLHPARARRRGQAPGVQCDGRGLEAGEAAPGRPPEEPPA